MPTITEVREKFPQYKDMSDGELADALHRKFYADMPAQEFRQKIGLKAEDPAGIRDEPNRSLLETVHDFAAGTADAAALSIPFADEAGAGVRALARGATSLLQGKDADLSGTYDRALADIRGRDKQYQEEHPVAHATAGILTGLTAGGTAARAATAPSSLLGTTAKSAATGAGYGGVYGFANGEDGLGNRLNSAAQGALTGGLLGAAAPLAGTAVSRIISPAQNRLTPEEQRLVQLAQSENIPLTPGQETGNRGLQTMESVFGTLPLTAGPQRAIQQTQREAFNRAALAHIGETADDLSPAVLGRARQRIGGEIDNLVSQTTVLPDQQFGQDLAGAVTEYSRRLDAMKKPVFENFVSDITDMMNQGGMPGATYQSTRSTLSQMAKSAGGSDPYFAQALRKLRDTLDDAADRSMPPNLKDAWKDARRQYGNLRTLEKAMSNTTTGAAAGNLQPTQLAQAVSQQHPRGGYSRGLGPMNDLSRVGDKFVRDQIPNSGTAERTMMTNLLQTGGMGYGGVAAYMGDPVHAALGIAGPLVAPRLAQMAYNTPLLQNYFRNQMGANLKKPLNQGLLTGVLSGISGGGLLGQ